jgi:PIN domain nuclease of toxin-antitoxin system
VIVLDASVMIMSLLRERGHEAVELLLETQPCAVSIVNLSEVHERLIREGASNAESRQVIHDIEFHTLVVDRPVAELAAILRSQTRDHGLGIADRICIATGMLNDAPIYTADRAWAQLDLPDADIQLVR